MNGKIIGLGAGVAVLLGAGGYVYASPYLALNSMKSAFEAKDAEKLSGYVDFPALRTDLKAEMKSAIAAEAAANPNDPQAQIGAAMGGAMADQMVDAMVTPQGVKKMVAVEKAGSGMGVTPNASADMQKAFSEMTLKRNGLSEFTLRNPNAPAKAALVFKRDGLSWKLVGIETPPVAEAKPAI